MVLDLKYVIIKDSALAIEYPILFPRQLVHRSVASFDAKNVVSAGFCDVGDGYSAYGFSESLGVESRPEDTEIIQRFFCSYD
jgi:hypothetical protein